MNFTSPLPGALRLPQDEAQQLIDDSLGYRLRGLLSSLRQQADAELAACGITNAHWIPLVKLYTGQASSVVELSRHCDLDGGATTRMLDRLEAKGLVQRVRSSADRRVVNLKLTDEGVAAAKAILPVLRQVQQTHLRGFSEQEWALFKSFLQRAIANGAHGANGSSGVDGAQSTDAQPAAASPAGNPSARKTKTGAA